MKKILIGAVRSVGNFTEGKRTIEYDNIKLYLADYRDGKTHGFSVGSNFEPVKIKTADFAEVSGISVKEFLSNFEKKYMFRKVRIMGEENDYGRLEVCEIKISEKKCFELWKELRDAELEKKLERLSEEDKEDTYDYDELEIDEESGEVLNDVE